jgi:NAD(P)-dependent dehydrogenase (short-subunit alcohol dehydrogenase family)
MTTKIILVTGASRGFGSMAANALAQSGHTVYASMRETAGRNAPRVAAAAAYAKEQGVDLRTIELDVSTQASVDAGIAKIIAEHRRIDVIVHNAGHRVFGPAEAFTPEQLAQIYDVNVLSTQRVNRAALPHMRKQGEGLLVWVSSSSSAGGTLPYLSPYFAAKAGMDALAVQYARELSRWGIETSIIVPGSYAQGADHFARAGKPADEARVAEYEAGPYSRFGTQIQEAFRGILPDNANPGAVAGAIVCVVDTPFGERPFRVHVDPGEDGASVAFAVIDRVRNEMLNRTGFSDLRKPRIVAPREDIRGCGETRSV